jgi:hypothetical protein
MAMEKNQQHHNRKKSPENMQSPGDKRQSGRLSTYPDGNLEETQLAESLPDNEIDVRPHGRTIAEATDPSKLSDI